MDTDRHYQGAAGYTIISKWTLLWSGQRSNSWVKENHWGADSEHWNLEQEPLRIHTLHIHTCLCHRSRSMSTRNLIHRTTQLRSEGFPGRCRRMACQKRIRTIHSLRRSGKCIETRSIQECAFPRYNYHQRLIPVHHCCKGPYKCSYCCIFPEDLPQETFSRRNCLSQLRLRFRFLVLPPGSVWGRFKTHTMVERKEKQHFQFQSYSQGRFPPGW